jgi:hypothetical protein
MTCNNSLLFALLNRYYFFNFTFRFCITDNEWNSECDVEDSLYKQQRRSSDPSSNLHDFTSLSWRKKRSSESQMKTRSENEINSIVSEISEIEAGDLRDGMYFFKRNSVLRKKGVTLRILL